MIRAELSARLPNTLSRSNKQWRRAISDSRSETGWRIAKRLALIALVAVLLGGAWLVCNGISTSLRAEHNLHSTLYVVRLVDEFVYQNQRWPESWSELEQLEFSGDAYAPRNGELNAIRVGGAMTFQWPSDSSTLQRRVTIQFDADPDVVAQQNPMEFDAIKPIGPFYEYCDYGIVESLQETVRTILAN